ncbi:ABC transporter permease subunit [Oceanicella sp. SM1341]|uniref:ABC transporter permease subunit n=1 Tax=Oceanicella sp. SM1341 TaxID=1548889 RepID=UPI000E4EAEAB|nr:ABC transporter permease subunit [Oceanicella sp. SM1341]
MSFISTEPLSPEARRARRPGPGTRGRTLARLAGRLAGRGWIGWLLPVALLLLWELLSATGGIRANVLPAPSAILAAFWRLLLSGDLAGHVAASTQRALLGFAIGGAIGFSLGLVNGLSRLARDVTDTTLQMVRNVPHLALIPLVILWFGIGEEAKIFLVALGVFFPIYVNTLLGVQGVDPQLVEMGRIYGMRRATLYRRVVLPGALPAIFTGLRYALGIMWLTLIVAETISASEGLGYMAMQAREFLQIDVVVLSILIYALLGKLADSLARLLERRTLQWHPSFRGKD